MGNFKLTYSNLLRNVVTDHQLRIGNEKLFAIYSDTNLKSFSKNTLYNNVQ